MQIDYIKESIPKKERTVGVPLASSCYVLSVNGEEMGYYYLAENAHYFTYWDDKGAIQHGLVDLWHKTIRHSDWCNVDFGVTVENGEHDSVTITIAGGHRIEMQRSSYKTDQLTTYMLTTLQGDGELQIHHQIKQLGQHQTKVTGSIICSGDNPILIYGAFLFLYLSFGIEY
jgi:hypothetical protein